MTGGPLALPHLDQAVPPGAALAEVPAAALRLAASFHADVPPVAVQIAAADGGGVRISCASFGGAMELLCPSGWLTGAPLRITRLPLARAMRRHPDAAVASLAPLDPGDPASLLLLRTLSPEAAAASVLPQDPGDRTLRPLPAVAPAAAPLEIDAATLSRVLRLLTAAADALVLTVAETRVQIDFNAEDFGGRVLLLPLQPQG